MNHKQDYLLMFQLMFRSIVFHFVFRKLADFSKLKKEIKIPINFQHKNNIKNTLTS